MGVELASILYIDKYRYLQSQARSRRFPPQPADGAGSLPIFPGALPTVTAPPLHVAKTQDQRIRAARERWRERGQQHGPRLPDGLPRAPFPERRAMRSPDVAKDRARPKAAPAPPSAAIVALSRLGFGPSEAAVAEFQALGATDAQRFQAFIDQQLDPASIDDSACDARLAQAGFQTLGKSVTQLWNQHNLAEDWEVVMRPFWETIRATWIRAIHSRRQLFEILVDFWHNHFNVYADDVPFGPMWVHSDRDAIRAHALGNFRQVVEAVTRTPAMLFYLNNAYNSNEDANENFARELLELHTLGSENYYGSMAPGDVPTDGEGVPLGYTETDVIEAARCLTGWTVETDWVHWEFGESGTFHYFPDWHDTGAKQVVGLEIPANQGALQDGLDLLDRVCRHPGTARHIAGKLCRRLLGDAPPQAVIDAAAATFLAHVDSADQIAQTVRTILEHPSFLTTWGDKVKRPFEIAVSMFRGAGIDLEWTIDDGITGWFLWEFLQTGQPLFGWSPPDGYPDNKLSWNTTSPRVMCWRLANMLLGIWNETTEYYYFDLRAMTPATHRSANELVSWWSQRILGRALPNAEEQILVAFMAQDQGADTDLDLTDWDTADRLRALVALILMSPTFLWK